MSSILRETPRSADSGGATADEGGIFFLGIVIGLVEINTRTNGNGIEGHLATAATRDEGSVVREVLEFASPQGEGTFETAATQVVVATVFNAEPDASRLGEFKCGLNVARFLNLDII